MQPNVRDKLTALEAQLVVQLPDDRDDDGDLASLSPVLGAQDHGREDGALVSKDTVNIQKDCGDDNICIPDLKIIHSR